MPSLLTRIRQTSTPSWAISRPAIPTTAAAGEDQLRKAVALDGKNVTSRLVLASLLQKKGDLAGAEENLKAAIVADPKSEIARATLADLYQRQGDAAKTEETSARHRMISTTPLPAPICLRTTLSAPNSLITQRPSTPTSSRSILRALPSRSRMHAS